VALEQYETRESSVPFDLDSIHRELATVRLRGGLSSARSNPLADVRAIGAPIFGSDGQIVGGFSLCDCRTGIPLDRYEPILVERAKRISSRLAASATNNRNAAIAALASVDA
jgi:DNA-binding IclR family transcriptional regulator